MQNVLYAIMGGMDEQSELWERQPNETAAAFYAFTYYRDLKPHERSLANAVRGLYPGLTGKAFDSKLRQFQKWSPNYDWRVRANAWDRHEDRRKQAAYLNKVDEMAERHAIVARSLIGKAAQALNILEVEDLTISDILKMFGEAVRLERLSMGVPEAFTKQQFVKDVDVTMLTDEELDVLRRG